MFRLYRQCVIASFFAIIIWGSFGPPGPAQPVATFQQQVEQYASQGRGTQAVAAQLITPEGTETAFVGPTGNPAQPVPTADTLFEIGSITKVFTALLLADQARQGQVALATPVGDLLPEEVAVDDEVAKIPLLALASHTAGLPRLPLSRLLWASLYPANPYRGSQPQELYQALKAAAPGQPTCQYSNLGPALLGQLLAIAAGSPYETLVQTQVLTPLGLMDTHFDLDPEATERLAAGHQDNTLPTANWQLDAYAPAGALKSTVNDMGRFLAAAMAADWPPMALSLQPRSADCEPNFGLGWAFTQLGAEPLIMHNGRTGGYYAFVGWLPEADRGLVLLTNTSDAQGNQVAQALLSGQPLSSDPIPSNVLISAVVVGGLLVYQSWQLACSRLPGDRLAAGEEAVESLLLLALIYQFGPWQWLPIGLWWGFLVLLFGLSSRRRWQLPPPRASPGSLRPKRWRWLKIGLILLGLIWVVACV